jgi:DNA repair protein RadA/Sms
MFGEVGLSGEIRSVSQPLARLKEAQSLGFKRAVLPEGNLFQLEKKDISGLNIDGVKDVKQALQIIL